MLTRRGLLAGAAGSAGAVIGAGAGYFAGAKGILDQGPAGSASAGAASAKRPNGFDDPLGIECEIHRHATLLSFAALPGTDRAAMQRWMALITDDIASLVAGTAPSGDPQPELAQGDGRLGISVGFGPTLFDKLGLRHKQPDGFVELPSFKIDRLEDRFSHGDVLIQIQGDLPLQVAHAARVLQRDSAAFARVKWQQDGFTQDSTVGNSTKVQRNLMGQVDGTDNPVPGSDDFTNLVRISDGPAWCRGGTQLVVRRIRMKLDTWDVLGRDQKESTIGRRLDNGAPLGAHHLNDPIDLQARDASGLTVIPDYAHVRRASATNLEERFYRRPYNYLNISPGVETADAGMLWMAYAKNLAKQYLPVQTRLADFDLLNVWTVPVGSATFVIAPPANSGEIIAQGLFV